MGNLLELLQRLNEAKIWYHLDCVRDAVMVILALPGERWEVEFFEDGHVEVERFISTGNIEDETALDEFFERYTGQEQRLS